MRTNIPAEVLAETHCAAGAFLPHKCKKKWEKWCGGCNLVFCGDHADPTFHACPPDDKPVFPGQVRPKRTTSKPRSKSEVEEKEEAG